jgi:hypothetical protein
LIAVPFQHHCHERCARALLVRLERLGLHTFVGEEKGRLEALTLLERFDEGFQCKCVRYVTGCVPAHAVGHRDGFFG